MHSFLSGLTVCDTVSMASGVIKLPSYFNLFTSSMFSSSLDFRLTGELSEFYFLLVGMHSDFFTIGSSGPFVKLASSF